MTLLTIKRLRAMQSALNAALAGAGFDGGDFDGQNPDDFKAALQWVEDQIAKKRRTDTNGSDPSTQQGE